jgi:hypothetical protein
MSEDNRDPVRAAFEKWAKAGGMSIAKFGSHNYPEGTYADSRTHAAWLGWAARAAISTPAPAPSSVDLTERSGEAVQRPLQKTERIAYLDGTDWLHHVGEDPHGVTIYPDAEDVETHAECGIVRVLMSEIDWPQLPERNLDAGAKDLSEAPETSKQETRTPKEPPPIKETR